MFKTLALIYGSRHGNLLALLKKIPVEALKTYFKTYFIRYTFLEKVPVIIDYLQQNEYINSATVDVQIEFNCKENISANIIAYCLILHDLVIEYPLSNIMRKIT